LGLSLKRGHNIKLSICIATRNRAKFIGATLESILVQATDDVEIVVLDGASTDNTEEVVRRYQARFAKLRYVRQDTNLGIDRDFARAVDLARGDYCWLFCDDDLFKPDAIQAVLEAIELDYALIVADSEIRNADLSRLLQYKKVQLTTNRVYKSNENDLLLADAGDYLSFIGGVIIKRRLWTEREKEPYFDSYFIHVGVIFQKPLPGDALVLAEPLVLIRYANASWLGKYFEIWMFKWPNLIWSFTDLSDSLKRRVCLKEPWRSPKKLLHLRAKGLYTEKEYAELLKPRLGSRWARFVSKTIAHFPGRLANLLAFLYYSIFCRASGRLLVLLDLENSPFCFWKLPPRRRSSAKVPDRVTAGTRLPSSASDSVSHH
jgi:glycosyltransferase involved in cell wall biosynthesis